MNIKQLYTNTEPYKQCCDSVQYIFRNLSPSVLEVKAEGEKWNDWFGKEIDPELCYRLKQPEKYKLCTVFNESFWYESKNQRGTLSEPTDDTVGAVYQISGKLYLVSRASGTWYDFDDEDLTDPFSVGNHIEQPTFDFWLIRPAFLLIRR